jgi:hypothetical protein
VVSFTASPLNPGERSSATHLKGGWVDRGTGNDMEKRKFLILPGFELQPFRRPAHSAGATLALTEEKEGYSN